MNLKPDHPALQILDAAEQALTRSDRLRAVNAIRQLMAQPAPLGEDWKRAVSVAYQTGDIDAAVESARRLCREDPDPLNNHLLLANMLEVLGDPKAGFAALEPHLESHADRADLFFMASHLAALCGERERASQLADTGLAIDPIHARLNYQRSQLHRFDGEDAGFTGLETAWSHWDEAGGATMERVATGFALAKACADRGDSARAAELWRGAAGLNAQRDPWLLDNARHEVSQLQALYTPDFIQRQMPSGIPGGRAIFILGAPRSGTTLVEQILAAHSAVTGGGEHALLSFACAPLEPQTGGALQRYLETARMGENRWTSLGGRYMQFVAARLGEAQRYTDKNLGNYKYLGAAALALPKARFIWCRRDAMDVAWSAWRTLFSGSMGWSYDVEALAGFLKLYDEAMTWWSDLFPGRILQVDYAALVRNSDAEIARLFEFVDLEDEAATRDFHASDRAVTTASFDQVRQPIHAGSIGAWKAFMPHIADLRDAVTAAGLAFDDI